MQDKKQISPCDFVMKARDNQPKPLTRKMFATLLNDMNVKMLCQKVREHGADAERYKIALPAVTWQSKFNGQLRTDRNAVPTGLFCLDVDIHHEPEFLALAKGESPKAAYEWAEHEAYVRARQWSSRQQEEDKAAVASADELGIVAIHISPSGTGVHVVACCSPFCKTIEENQQRLARLLGTSYDPVCKDWARIFFVVPAEDWYYIDMDGLFGEEEQ